MPDAICPQHGPYNAELGRCPYCARNSSRPLPPTPLDEEPTEIPYAQRAGDQADGEEEDVDRTVIDQPQTGLLGWLIVKSGGGYGQIHKIKPGAIMGRDIRKADLVLVDEKISAMHAKITIKNGQFLLSDLGSSNGTFVNGQEIAEPTAIQENDEIRLGNLSFVLKTLSREP